MDHSEDNLTIELPSNANWTDSPILKVLERDHLPDYLASCRWFPIKSAKDLSIKILTVLPLSHETLFLAILDAGKSGLYALPIKADWSPGVDQQQKSIAAICQSGRHGTLRDMASSPDFIRLLLRYLENNNTINAREWSLVFKATSAMSAIANLDEVPVRAIKGEQSNTTTLVDHTHVVKIYRHVECGQNPEAEMGSFLTGETEFSATPALVGHVEVVRGDQIFALAVVHTYVPNHGDAWIWSADRLQIYLNAGPHDQSIAMTVRRDYLSWATTLGRRVAQMHLALASRPDITAFQPLQVTTADTEAWRDNLYQRAQQVFDELGNRTDLPGVDEKMLEKLERTRPLLLGLINDLSKAALASLKIRHHGDFHLGQVLVTDEDAIIIDFEGEPKRSLEERRQRAPAARDVAGMIRSLDYSAMSAQLQAPGTNKAVLAWRDQSVQSFLEGYRKTMGNSPLWPTSAQEADNILKFFVLEKTIYEVEYELAYRPAWVRVPLQGVVNLLSES